MQVCSCALANFIMKDYGPLGQGRAVMILRFTKACVCCPESVFGKSMDNLVTKISMSLHTLAQ